MSTLQEIADRVEIAALQAEYTDAVMMHDFDRLAGLFTSDAVISIPDAGIELAGRERIRSASQQLQARWAFFVQNTHAGYVRVDEDSASGRAYVVEFGDIDGGSELNYSIYHDRYRRTSEGWRFVERVYEVRYRDTTALTGVAVP